MRIVFVVAAALVLAAGASAAGGMSIASAPIVKPGIQETENTTTDQTRRGTVGSALSLGCWNDFEFWRLPLVAGDKVAIAGNSSAGGYHFAVGVFPAGTTDKTIHSVASILNAFPANHTAHFTAKTTGTYPLVIGPNCYDGSDGGFTFVATVTRP